ncbi:MAG: DUF4231 domain-containing protein [Pseudomonadota bacterium]
MSLTAEQIGARESYAGTLTRYAEQQAWYSTRADQLKKRAQWTDLAVIGLGALVAALPGTMSASGVGWFLVSALGVAIAILQGGQRVFRSGEIWPTYRQAAEAMRREHRLFVYGAPGYPEDFELACAMYLQRLDSILSTEQNDYFAKLKTPTETGNQTAE